MAATDNIDRTSENAMAKKRIQPNDEEIAQRARNLARQLSGRLFVSKDGVYLVSGTPDFRTLRECLSQIQQPPEREDAPSPMDLGFSPTQITPLSSQGLTAWGRGLQKWRKILQDYEQPRQKTTERRRKYRRWKEEIEHLTQLLEQHWQTFRALEHNQLIHGAPYVSEHSGKEIGIHEPILQDAKPLWAWLEQIVIWIAGDSAGHRFRKSLHHFAGYHTTLRTLSRLRSLLHHRNKLSRTELVNAIRDVLNDVPEKLRIEFNLNPPYRERDININANILACEKNVEAKLPPVALVGSAAALCATDGATSLVPPSLFFLPDLSNKEERKRAHLHKDRDFIELYDESGKAGYGLLLHAISKMADGYHKRSFREMRQFLAAGVEIDDAQWAVDNLNGSRLLAEKGLSPRPFRTLLSILQQAGIAERDLDIFDTIEKVAKRGNMNIVEAFAHWLSSVSTARLQPGLAKWAWNCLQQLLILEGANPALINQLRQWADPPAFSDYDAPVLSAAPRETQVWLSRLEYYQRLCGKQPTLPKSLARILTTNDREAQELEYLREARSNNVLNDRMAVRLSLLEKRKPRTQTAGGHRILRKAREVCAHAALDAVRHIAAREGQRAWQQHIGLEPPNHLSGDEIASIAAWATGQNKTALKCLRELLAAWCHYGMEYRKHLSLNKTWIEAASHHVDLNAWFTPEPCEVEANGLHIGVNQAMDPFRIFLMGSYFDTCLSLDEFNRDSVLANAYDANKAVIFALGLEGQILARKLVCINSIFHLIGYRTYIASDDTLTPSMRKYVASMVDAFCGRWARNMEVPLGYTGAPAHLSGLFWHDDGVSHWSPSAMHTWTDPSLDILDATSITGRLLPVVSEALKTRRDKCLRLLRELWDGMVSETNASIKLDESAGLAEESLALLARNEGNKELARLVFENAVTLGGQQEAMTSVALLEKSDEMAEYTYTQAKNNCILAERAMEILRGFGSKKAWHLFMKLIIQGDSSYSRWIPLAATDSDDATKALFEQLIVSGTNALNYQDLILTSEILLARDKPLPKAVIVKALLPEDEDDYPCDRYYLSQWLPICNYNLKRSKFEKIATTDTSWENSEQYALMAAIITAMKNPGPGATAFLRKVSENNPSALLALALQAGSKYGKFIRKRALDMASEPAAILALIITEGEKTTSELLTPTFGKIPNQKERLSAIRQLYVTFRDMAIGKPSPCLPDFFKSSSALSTAPYVLHYLWNWTDPSRPNIAAIAALKESRFLLNVILKAIDVDFYGFAARLASLLRKADKDYEDTIKESLLYLIDEVDMLRQNNYALFLDKLADHKLFGDSPLDAHEPVHINVDDLYCAAIWGLFLNDMGEERDWVKHAAWQDLYYVSLPSAPILAARVVRLLRSYAPSSVLDELQLTTEWQKQLVLQSAQPASNKTTD